MKTQIKDGGSAFPEVETDLEHKVGDPYPRTYSYGGMTLRDYFAAKAMAALIRNYTNPADFEAFKKQSLDKKMSIPALMAAMAYENADAMLKAREQSQP